jgi:iron(III) transport system permease protein
VEIPGPISFANVLPGALRRTFGLMAGVGALTLLIGTSTAWLVTMCRFMGQRFFQWLLLLPLAIPTYIIAYAYLEMLDYSGILQTTLRATFGWHDGIYRDLPDDTLSGARGVLASLACAVPILFGFLLPALVLMHDAAAHVAAGLGQNSVRRR